MARHTSSLSRRRGAADREEISRALTEHIASLRRYARALLGSSAEGDDLVQECLTRALAKARPWDQVRDTRAYLFTILHNLHVDRVARRRRSSGMVPLEEAAPYLSYPAAQHSRLELRDLARALDELPEEQRQVLLLVGLEGFTYRETAEIMDIPIGTVMSRLSRAREALRRMLAGDMAPRLRVVK